MNKIPVFEDLTDEQVKKLCNGVGPKGWAWLLPQFCFKNAANHHDFYYWRGGNELDKKYADELFYELMMKDLKAHKFNVIKFNYEKAHAWLYYMSVVKEGNHFFEYRKSYKTWYDLMCEIYPVKLTEEQLKFVEIPTAS